MVDMKANKLEIEMGGQLLAAHERADRLVALIQHTDACRECGETSYLHCDRAQELLREMKPGDMPEHMMVDLGNPS